MNRKFTKFLIGAFALLFAIPHANAQAQLLANEVNLAKTDANSTVTGKSKTGTTITLDHGSSEALYTTNGQNNTWFSFLRHKATHIQLMVSSDANLKPGQPLFKDVQNNMQWTGNETSGWKLQLANGQISSDGKNYTRYQYSHYSILAPKGYRFLRYEIVIASGSTNGVKLEEYTYKDGSSSEIQLVGPTASASASSTSDVTLQRTLDNPTNVLYFRQDALDAKAIHSIYIKSIKLVYAVDNAFNEQLPNENGTGFHSGFIDFGTTSTPTDGKHNYGFSAEAPTDLENVNVKMTDGTTPQTVSVDGSNYFMATTDGDYYVEAPTKFRIVGATINLKRAAVSSSKSYTPSTTSNGEQIYFQANDDSQNYLKINDAGDAVNTSNKDEATLFTLTYQTGNGENHYSLKMSNGRYLVILNNKVTTTTDQALWAFDGAGLKYYASGAYIYLGNNADGKYTWDPRKKQKYCPHIYNQVSVPASDFTATVYSPDNSGATTDGVKQLTKSAATSSVTVDNLNNDAVHINLSGIQSGSTVLFNVLLKMIALNPEVETVEAAVLVDGSSNATGNSPVTSENYIFNNGNTINVPVVSGSNGQGVTMVFRNAKNEELTNWYTNGVNTNGASETGSYSNVYLIGSSADSDNGLALSSPVPDARTAVDKIGTTKIDATNISDVANKKANTLQDNTPTATTAGYQTVTMTIGSTDEPTTYYLYSADKPTNNIMPSDITLGKHIDFRFYSIKVKPVVAEKPLIKIVPIYSSTMKGQQHKKSIENDGSNLNTTDKYVGIKVTSQLNDGVTSGAVTGSLTAEAIYSAMTDALKNSDYKTSDDTDPLRNVLYVDMSALNTVTTADATTMSKYATATADNCLFFMPKGFAATNMTNTIAKQQDGTTYQAIGDVRVYDQQPFFTPYSFTTGQFKAFYKREGTVNADVAQVRKMAVVLPFDITLDAGGHPYLSGATDATSYITFRNITKSGELTAVQKDNTGHELTYAVLAEEVKTLKAEANKPYYVSIDETGPVGFDFNIPNANFASTPDIASDKTADPNNLQSEYGSWTAHGTYNGVAPAVAENLWYFSKDYFWKSEQLKPDFAVVNVRPFRAYFTTSLPTGSNAKATVVFNLNDIVTTGISNINAASSKTGKVYTIDGRYVGNSLENLAPGIYIQNGRKVVKQ